MIGEVLKDLISIIEQEDYEYYEIIGNEIVKTEDEKKKKIKGKDVKSSYVIAKKRTENILNENTIQILNGTKEALIIYDGFYPVKRIPLFTSKNYQQKIKNYDQFPYVLDFLDYCISKKSKNKFYSNKYPEYTKKELYTYLSEYFIIYKENIKEKDEYLRLIKTMTEDTSE